MIHSYLTEPPSEVCCFRDVTLYAKTFIVDDILLICPTGTRNLYWKWLKSHGAHDFVSDLILPHEKKPGISIGANPGFNIITDRITCNNLSEIIGSLSRFR